MSMFSARILSALPRRRFYTFLPSSASTSSFALLHAYPSNSPHAKSYNDIPSSNTSTAPPPRNPTNHADAPPAKPTTQPDSAYWNDQSPAIKSSSSSTRPAPEPSDSPLTGQVESVEINVAPGVKLEGHKRQVVGAVLDLLKGNVTVHKMSRSFWAEDAVFEDNMNKAVGINEVEGHAVSGLPHVRDWV